MRIIAGTHGDAVWRRQTGRGCDRRRIACARRFSIFSAPRMAGRDGPRRLCRHGCRGHRGAEPRRRARHLRRSGSARRGTRRGQPRALWGSQRAMLLSARIWAIFRHVSRTPAYDVDLSRSAVHDIDPGPLAAAVSGVPAARGACSSSSTHQTARPRPGRYARTRPHGTIGGQHALILRRRWLGGPGGLDDPQQ